MENKTALLFVDGDTIKIVTGKLLKLIPHNEINAPHNVKFIEQLFETTNVLMVDKVSALSKEAYDEFALSFRPKVAAKPENAAKPLTKSYPPSKTVPMNKSGRTVPEILREAEDDANAMLYRSTAETCITVDDLPTGTDIPMYDRDGNPIQGVKMNLAIYPDRAVNLAGLPQENIAKSKILKRLIADGVLVPCTRAEANAMDAEYNAKSKELSDLSLNHDAPILTESVASFASRTSKNGRLDINAMDAESIEIENSAPLTKEEAALTNLINSLPEDREPEEIGEPDPMPAPPRRPLAARPAPQMSSELKPKGTIGKRHTMQ